MPNDPDLTPEMSPCPFCGDAETGGAVRDGRWAIWCDHCYAYGPWRDTEDEAIAAWNTRAMQALSRPIAGDVERVARAIERTEAWLDNGLTPEETSEIAHAALASMPAPVGEAVERITAWLYKREGGVAFEELPLADQEHWRKQGRELAAIAAPVGVVEALEEARRTLAMALSATTGTRATIHVTRLRQAVAKIDTALNSLRSGDGR